MIRLSERLATVYNNLLPRKDVWDICCDHGYLGTASYKSNNFANIYFVDRVPTIINKLKSQFQKYAFKSDSPSQANFICASAQDIEINLTGTACITGVGGLAIIEILDGLAKKNFLNVDRLILGPHRDEIKLIEIIRNSPRLNRFSLVSDIKIVESNINRSIFVLDRTI